MSNMYTRSRAKAVSNDALAHLEFVISVAGKDFFDDLTPIDVHNLATTHRRIGAAIDAHRIHFEGLERKRVRKQMRDMLREDMTLERDRLSDPSHADFRSFLQQAADLHRGRVRKFLDACKIRKITLEALPYLFPDDEPDDGSMFVHPYDDEVVDSPWGVARVYYGTTKDRPPGVTARVLVEDEVEVLIRSSYGKQTAWVTGDASTGVALLEMFGDLKASFQDVFFDKVETYGAFLDVVNPDGVYPRISDSDSDSDY